MYLILFFTMLKIELGEKVVTDYKSVEKFTKFSEYVSGLLVLYALSDLLSNLRDEDPDWFQSIVRIKHSASYSTKGELKVSWTISNELFNSLVFYESYTSLLIKMTENSRGNAYPLLLKNLIDYSHD